MYSPELRRWLDQDPIGELGGMNLYGFVGNDPVNEVDPFGLDDIYAGAPSGGTYNNNVPNITLSAPVGGGPVNTQFNGGGLGDPIFMLTLEAGPPAWLAGGSLRAGGRAGLALKLLFVANKLARPKPAPTKEQLNQKYPRCSPWRKGVGDDVYQYAQSISRDGKVYDPTSGIEIHPNDPWEFGHEPNYKFSDWQQRAWDENWSDEDWNNFLNDAFYYRPETWRSNSSHEGEDSYP
jgi:hypothetical protein